MIPPKSCHRAGYGARRDVNEAPFTSGAEFAAPQLIYVHVDAGQESSGQQTTNKFNRRLLSCAHATEPTCILYICNLNGVIEWLGNIKRDPWSKTYQISQPHFHMFLFFSLTSSIVIIHQSITASTESSPAIWPSPPDTSAAHPH